MVAHVIHYCLSIHAARSLVLILAVAEKTFSKLKEMAEQNPEVHFIGVSHSDQPATEKWLKDIGGAARVQVVVDDHQESFSAYGLGLSSLWAVLNPSSLFAAINLGKTEGYGVRPTESGSRWQEAGVFAVDANGRIAYSHRAQTSDDLGDLAQALRSVKAPVRAQL